MRLQSHMDRIFPIGDDASALLAIVKAHCLHSAGVITEADKTVVISRAAAALNGIGASTAVARVCALDDIGASLPAR